MRPSILSTSSYLRSSLADKRLGFRKSTQDVLISCSKDSLSRSETRNRKRKYKESNTLHLDFSDAENLCLTHLNPNQNLPRFYKFVILVIPIINSFLCLLIQVSLIDLLSKFVITSPFYLVQFVMNLHNILQAHTDSHTIPCSNSLCILHRFSHPQCQS